MRDTIVFMHDDLQAPDTGSLRGDYEAMASLVRSAAQRAGAATLMPRLLGETANDPDLHTIFYDNLVEPRRAQMRTILQRAIARRDPRRHRHRPDHRPVRRPGHLPAPDHRGNLAQLPRDRQATRRATQRPRPARLKRASIASGVIRKRGPEAAIERSPSRGCERGCRRFGWRLFAAVNSPAVQVPAWGRSRRRSPPRRSLVRFLRV